MKRIFTEQLVKNLERELANIYYLVGQDLLLQTESRDLILKAALSNGFDEKFEIIVDNSTDWDSLFEQIQSMGLFFNRQVIFITLPENISASIQKKLQQLISLLHSDILLVLQFPKLTKLMEKQLWFLESEQYDPLATLINCQTPNANQLPTWIVNRAKSMSLTIDEDAVELLCYSYENNLLALKQSLQLLALLYPEQKITYKRVEEVVEQSSIFTVFQWIDALFDGNLPRAKRILNGLQVDDVQPIILLRTLQRELMTILDLTKPQNKLTSIDEPLHRDQLRENFDRLKIWQNRRPFFIQVIQRFNYRKLYLVIQQLADIERIAKQEFTDILWEKLLDISIEMSQSKI